VREANGRFRYENLSDKVLRGTASADEADEVAQMTSWQEFAGPIYHAAVQQVSTGVGAAWRQTMQSAVAAEKLEPEIAERLYRAPDPIREAIRIGAERERKRAAKEAKNPPRPVTARVSVPTSSRPAPPPGPSGEPWLDGMMAHLDRTMATAAKAANSRARRELAELEAAERRRRRISRA
jgi:hypothetical protein